MQHVKTAFKSFGMGAKLFATNGHAPVNGDISPRPVKRPRVADDSEEAARHVASRLIFDETDDFNNTLQVAVLCITDNSGPRPQYGNGSPDAEDIPVVKAFCKVLICEHSKKVTHVLYADTQLINFKVFRDELDDMVHFTRLYAVPFQIPAEKLFVARKDKRWHYADEYLVRVEIGYAGDPKWPPVDFLPEEHAHILNTPDAHQWYLSSQVLYSFKKGKSIGDVMLCKDDEKINISLGRFMQMDLKWSTSRAAGSTAQAGESITSSITSAHHTNGPLEPLTNGHVNGRTEPSSLEWAKVNGEGMDLVDDDEDLDEATTPSRSLRHREKQNYNLKLLSDKARGRERKERKQRKLAGLGKKSGRVTWIIPLVGKITVENLNCMRCFEPHSSVEQLMDHVRGHTDIKHSIDPDRAYIRLIPLNEDPNCPLPLSHFISSPEDHDTDFEGDISPQRPPRKPSHQSKQHLLPTVHKPRDNKQTIPNIKQPIFDRLSKALLEPGSVVDTPLVNDAWLVQKHREIIRDYSDVDGGEKEFIYEWDAFVNRECVTSEPHLQDVYIRFVQDKASWITASQNRTTEWSKHLTYLKSRNALTDNTIANAFSIMRQYKSHNFIEQPEPPKVPSPRSGYRKSVTGCAVCGQPVRGAGSLICSEVKCDTALYHKECARPTAKLSVDSRNWRCNNCNND
ncbi:hypothetical protein F5Y16DRAFT_385759 [Xylariaceae sp. FL0255]|nr:hypothetical protein F5Y16DRAFT_385759 [Xylariaceae sp. FL0255]